MGSLEVGSEVLQFDFELSDSSFVFVDGLFIGVVFLRNLFFESVCIFGLN